MKQKRKPCVSAFVVRCLFRLKHLPAKLTYHVVLESPLGILDRGEGISLSAGAGSSAADVMLSAAGDSDGVSLQAVIEETSIAARRRKTIAFFMVFDILF